MNFEDFLRNNGMLLSEDMPLIDMQHIGDWGKKSKSNHGYDKQSISIHQNPVGVKKIGGKFDQSPVGDWAIYFIKKPNASKHSEIGVLKDAATQVPEMFGIKLGVDIPYHGDDETVTVIFTNNKAAEKVPLTAWTIAHRIGHAFWATNRGGDWNTDDLIKQIAVLLREFFQEVYGVRLNSPTYGSGGLGLINEKSNEKVIRGLFESIGTMRSARQRLLPRPFEFFFECFAQWLFTGDVTLKTPPPVIPVGKQRTLRTKLEGEDFEDAAEFFRSNLQWRFIELFEYWTSQHMGHVSVM